MNRAKQILILALASITCTCDAQLSITLSPTKAVGQNAITVLALKNNLNEQIDSARAVMFLLDKDGKVVAQATRWIVSGETNRPPLAAGATNSFHFVVPTAGKLFVTNRLMVVRVNLANGTTANPVADVRIET